jgi:hypothetical protein
MERQEPSALDARPETPPVPEEKRAYEPPKVESVRLTGEAAEALT